MVKFGVYYSLHPNCYHQIIFAKINLKIFCPPPYENEISHYEKANAELIRRSESKSTFILSNHYIYSKNFVPHVTITLMFEISREISKIKDLIRENSITKKCYFQNNNLNKISIHKESPTCQN